MRDILIAVAVRPANIIQIKFGVYRKIAINRNLRARVDMEVLGRRKSSLLILNIIGMLLAISCSVTSLFVGLNDARVWSLMLTGIVLFLLFIIVMIFILRTPPEAIKFDGNKTLVFPHDCRISLDDVTEVSFTRALGRSVQYYWGTVTVKTAGCVYKVRYIDDCEGVARKITQILQRHTNRNNQNK